MSTQFPATDPSKTALENSVSYFLADKLQDPATTIATKKFLTGKNELIYLTRCNVAELAVPRVKVQIFMRVDGGVHETGYQLFGDHRFVKYENAMIFGTDSSTPAGDKMEDVTEQEAKGLLEVVNSLADARQTL